MRVKFHTHTTLSSQIIDKVHNMTRILEPMCNVNIASVKFLTEMCPFENECEITHLISLTNQVQNEVCGC